MSTVERRARLGVRHRLVAEQRVDDVAQIADDLVALHSSDPATVYLSVMARMQRPQLGAVDEALYDARTLVRHHAMRRTLWVMTRETARRAHSAATAKIADAERKKTLAALAGSEHVDDARGWYDTAVHEVTALLTDRGSLTTREVGDALAHLVMPIVFGAATKHPAPINAHTKILQGAGFDAALIRTRPSGSWNSSEYAWDSVEAWLGGSIAGGETRRAAAELLDHWLHRFGPATDNDIRWWFGWTAKMAVTALTDVDAQSVWLDDGTAAWLSVDDLGPFQDVAPWVRLLPGLDATTMGWKDRDWYLPPEMLHRVFDRTGNAGPTIWVDGCVVGGWIQRPDGEIVFDLLAPLSRGQRKMLDEAAAELTAVVGDTIVKPRFPSRNQPELLGPT